MPKPTRPKRKTAPKTRTKRMPFAGREALLPLIAVLVAGVAAVMFFLSAPEKPEEKPVKPRKPGEVSAQKTAPAPKPAVVPDEKPPAAETPAAVPVKPADDGLPRIAIVIDDMGADLGALDTLIGFSVPIGVAILPHQPHSGETALRAKAAGLDVLLHLPMQADAKYTGLGQGALFTDMGRAEVAATLERDLAEVPGAIGVNNHMGSAFTADKASMTFVLGELKARGLFFLDSRTTAETVAESTAREMGVPTAARKVFLDDSNDIDDVRFQFERLVNLARKNGAAIAIGHPRPATLRVLGEELPGLKGAGIRVVRVSGMVD